jgi:hypothetical protein
MHTDDGTDPPADERDAGPARLRARLLRFLEAAERGLAQAYLEQAPRWGERRALEEAALRHVAHAELLRALRSGGPSGVDRTWVLGPPDEPATLATAERHALETLHDCLSDLDPPTAARLLESVIAEHARTLKAACERAGIDPNREGSFGV